MDVMAVQGSNIGRSNYQGLNLRLERRMRNGLFALLNYTFLKTLDDAGGPDVGNGAGVNGTNTGGKRAQTVDPITRVYVISPLDETHVTRLTFNREFPVGRGKKLLGSPDNSALKALDYAIGGWFPAQRLHFVRDRPRVTASVIPMNDPRLAASGVRT